MNLARHWPRLEELWQRTEHEQVKYGYPKKLHLNIKIISAVTLAIALGKLCVNCEYIRSTCSQEMKTEGL
jgi:hypothetical protein